MFSGVKSFVVLRLQALGVFQGGAVAGEQSGAEWLPVPGAGGVRGFSSRGCSLNKGG